MLTKNQLIEIEITDLTSEGNGVGHYGEERFAIFVPNTAPGDRAEVRFPDGSVAIFYANSLLVEYNGRFRSMRKPSTKLCGTFYVPVAEFCADFMGKFVSEAADVLVIADHSVILGRYTARILRKVLGGFVRAIK